MYSIKKGFDSLVIPTTTKRDQPIVTISKTGLLGFNANLRTEFEMKKYTAVSFLLYRNDNVLGLVFSNRLVENSMALGKESVRYQVNIGSVLRTNEIDFSKSKRYIPIINKNENAIFIKIDDGEICNRKKKEPAPVAANDFPDQVESTTQQKK